MTLDLWEVIKCSNVLFVTLSFETAPSEIGKGADAENSWKLPSGAGPFADEGRTGS